ncbi:hypothetical protein ILUMI_09026 [Ignelater luminosus]|uniref:Uncharacterized protein n=1 Tax=Ignelater luminosus TaxID=2038154 RepID=A0A8K0GCU9_IGNLU|nr:hypothetical protein ILUMI_09026 [Ignelater luminosus]
MVSHVTYYLLRIYSESKPRCSGYFNYLNAGKSDIQMFRRFVQLKKNRSFYRGIQRTPYEAMFGVPIINGLSDSNLPLEIIEKLENEDDIYTVQKTAGKNIENRPSDECSTELLNNDNTNNATNEKNLQRNFSINQPEYDNVEKELSRDNETRLISINQHRSEGIKSLKKQAAKMIQQSCSKYYKVEIGQNVLVKIPDVDKGHLAPHNILAVVSSEREDLYQLGTSTGVLEKLYAIH